jgi:hypothetical protein
VTNKVGNIEEKGKDIIINKEYVPELADNNFRNMVLLSASDVLFKLYYEKLEDEIENQLKSFIKY